MVLSSICICTNKMCNKSVETENRTVACPVTRLSQVISYRKKVFNLTAFHFSF